MSTTDADLIADVAWRVLESSTLFPSGLWSVAEITNYANQRQNRFNRDAKLLLAHQPIAFSAGDVNKPLPDDWIATLNASWTDDPTGVSTTVGVGDRYAAEALITSTNNPPDRPTILDDSSAGPLTVELFPTPATDGELELLYACVLETLHGDPLAPDVIDLPDDFFPYLVYGVLADMLSKEGRGQDLARAQYCEQRFQEGILLSAVLLEGYF